MTKPKKQNPVNASSIVLGSGTAAAARMLSITNALTSDVEPGEVIVTLVRPENPGNVTVPDVPGLTVLVAPFEPVNSTSKSHVKKVVATKSIEIKLNTGLVRLVRVKGSPSPPKIVALSPRDA